MPFEQHGALRYYYFSRLKSAGLHHAAVTRHGGVSHSPWRSLNLGGSVGDSSEHVIENKRLVLQKLGFGVASVFDVWQVHGASVAVANTPRPTDMAQPQADIILTDQPRITLLMRFADCVPVLLFDPQHRVAGIVHAGWQGTVKKAVQTAVYAMEQRYRSSPAQIMAAIGPSIGPDHYQIGDEVTQQVETAFGSDAVSVLASSNGTTHFDLWKANQILLDQAGVLNIETAGICTACHVGDWYSHRAENGRTGRFGVLVGLE